MLELLLETNEHIFVIIVIGWLIFTDEFVLMFTKF